jgi:hypothetical protein
LLGVTISALSHGLDNISGCPAHVSIAAIITS